MFLIKNIFLLTTVAMMTENCLSLFPLLRRQIPSSNDAAYQFKISIKKLIQTDKVYSRKIVTKLYLVPHY